MRGLKIILISGTLLFLFSTLAFGQSRDLLSPEEVLWLESRNNVIVVYPVKNNPPFSYSSTGGNIQGLGIDYIELVADKVGAKVEYLSPKSLNQVLDDITTGKGDVVPNLMDIDDRASEFIFSDSFITVPTAIVVRKDYKGSSSLTLNDFNGKKVSVVSDSALEKYIKKNYPRVIIEDVTDDEVSLQQVVLGEVDAATMDIASLSFYLSKQVLSSVKIAGNTGFDYKPAFGLKKDKAILQSILDKGMSQISSTDRGLLNEKWIAIPIGEYSENGFWVFIKNNIGIIVLYFILLIVLIILAIFAWKMRSKLGIHYLKKGEDLHELKEQFRELAEADEVLAEELKKIKSKESKLRDKIKSLEE